MPQIPDGGRSAGLKGTPYRMGQATGTAGAAAGRKGK